MGRLLPRAQILLTFILLVAATACEQRIFTPPAVDAGVEVDAPGWQGPVIKFSDAAAIDRACVPIGCATAAGKYCGKIGDGCGGLLDCGGCEGAATCGGAGLPNVCAVPPGPGCTPLACEQPGGKLCGTIGDGCGKAKECGGCPAGQTCGGGGIAGVCGAPRAASCKPLNCEQAGGRLCGRVGDGCGGVLECGGCPGGQTCGGAGTPNVCGADGTTCRPLACEALGGKYCGTIGDGCGKTLDCGGCPAGQTCGGAGTPGVCGTPNGACRPLTCEQAGGRFCGTIGDGCGGTLECGDCPGGDGCGARAIAGVCGKPAGLCSPVSCDQPGGRYCGQVGDGCGGILDCGACPAGQACGGAGVTGVCAAPAGSCTPAKCEQAGGRLCGKVGDGCGKTLDCGECPAGQTCGGAGTPGVCGAPAPTGCAPVACEQAGVRHCGRIGDGCGRALECGECPAGQTCGGAGTPGVCGAPIPASCVPVTCEQAGGKYCGTIGDGCGKALDCGGCAAGQTCGGGGVPGVCGTANPACVPLTCEQAGGKYCGKIGDGCGGTLDCGGCAAGQTCGGGGVPGVCGSGTGCTGLCEKQVRCPKGSETIVTGTVLAPTPPQFGVPDPIYNAVVYVPNGPVQPFGAKLSCERCGELSGSPIVSTLSGIDGKFTLKNVPVGENIPLVIQLGRWRRQVTIPKVTACDAVTLPAELTRLPRNKAEGDIPLTAIATGKVDTMECVLRKMGIDDSEFTAPGGTGRVHIYQSNGAVIGPNTPRLADLTASLDNLMKYNLVIFPCEGAPLPKPRSDQERIVQYANAGGRLFFTHYSWTWLNTLPPFSDTATWNTDQPAPADPLIGTVDQSFPKGKAFAEWLNLVNAAAPLPGLIQIKAPRNDLTAVKGSSQRWIYSTDPATVQHYTFNTPVGATGAAQCGRVVFSDFHVTDVPSIDGATFPSECKPGGLTPQEKVLEFMLFDLANCIQADTVTPELLGPPPVAPPVLPPPVPMSVAPPPVAPPTQPAPAPPAMSPMLPLSSPPAPMTKIPPPPAPPAVPPVMPPMAPPPAPPVAPKGE